MNQGTESNSKQFCCSHSGGYINAMGNSVCGQCRQLSVTEDPKCNCPCHPFGHPPPERALERIPCAVCGTAYLPRELHCESWEGAIHRICSQCNDDRKKRETLNWCGAAEPATDPPMVGKYWFCTRPKGHTGNHHARLGGSGEIVHSWLNSSTERRTSEDRRTIDHPPHYTFGTIEVITAIEDWGLGFHLGNVVKYVVRSPHKGSEVQDLEKAKWYLERWIEKLKGLDKGKVEGKS